MKVIVTMSKVLMAAACVALACAGCTNSGASSQCEPLFSADDGSRAVWQSVNAQAAAGARDDATLYARHFDGNGKVSTLGRQKLDMMLHASPPVSVVYLDVSGAAESGNRSAVAQYLADAGIAADSVKLIAGPNPANSHAASEGTSRWMKTENPRPLGDAGTASGGTGTEVMSNVPAR